MYAHSTGRLRASSSMDDVGGRPRILCLHGWHGTAAILRRQMTGLTVALADSADLTFIEAPSLARRSFGWWQDGFAGWEESRDALLDLLRAQRFDGLFGFSQGAAMTGLLAGVLQAEGHDRRVDFAVMVGGFTSNLAEHARLFTTPIRLPSLHVIGRSDTIVAPRDSHALAARFADPELLEHPDGHIVPATDSATRRIAHFIRANTQEVAAP
jgi:pimeloyl-ACP methyl ester carboxylesterase